MQLRNIPLIIIIFLLSNNIFSQGLVIEVEGVPIDVSGQSYSMYLTESSSTSGQVHLVNFKVFNNTASPQEWWVTRKIVSFPPVSWQDFIVWQVYGDISVVNLPNNDTISHSFETAVVPIGDSAFFSANLYSNQGGSAIYRYYISSDKVNWIDSVDLIVNSVASNNKVNENTILVYPNPATDVIYFTEIGSKNETTIINSMGELVETNARSNNTIDISKLSKGIYFLLIQTDKGLVTKKIIKK